MMQTMRMLALGVTLTFCALATGAIGLKVYADLSKFRQIDVSSIDLYLGNLRLDHERLRLVYSDDRQDHNPNQVKSDIKHSISVVLAHKTAQSISGHDPVFNRRACVATTRSVTGRQSICTFCRHHVRHVICRNGIVYAHPCIKRATRQAQ